MADFTTLFGAKYQYFEHLGVHYRVDVATDNTQALDPATDTWSDVTAVPGSGYYAPFVSGGTVHRINATTNDLEVLDPATDTWGTSTTVTPDGGPYEYAFDDTNSRWTRIKKDDGTVEYPDGSGGYTTTPPAATAGVLPDISQTTAATDWVDTGTSFGGGSVSHVTVENGKMFSLAGAASVGPQQRYHVTPNGKSWAMFNVTGGSPAIVGGAINYDGILDIVWDGLRYVGLFKFSDNNYTILWSDTGYSWDFPTGRGTTGTITSGGNTSGTARLISGASDGNVVIMISQNPGDTTVYKHDNGFAAVDDAETDPTVTRTVLSVGDGFYTQDALYEPVNGHMFVVGGSAQLKVHRSDDEGATWSTVFDFTSVAADVQDNRIMADANGTLVLTGNGNLSADWATSSDGGVTWTTYAAPAGTMKGAQHPVVVDNVIYVSNDSAIYAILDGLFVSAAGVPGNTGLHGAINGAWVSVQTGNYAYYEGV